MIDQLALKLHMQPQKIHKSLHFAGYTTDELNQPCFHTCKPAFNNYEVDLNQQTSQFQNAFVGQLRINPTKQNVDTYKCPLEIFNKTGQEIYDLRIQHTNSDMQGLAQGQQYTVVSKSMDTKKFNKFGTKKLNRNQKTSTPPLKFNKTKKPKETSNFDLPLNYNQKNKLKKPSNGIKKPPKYDDEEVDPAQNQQVTNYIFIQFRIKRNGQNLTFTNKPFIGYLQDNKRENFRQLKFSLIDYFDKKTGRLVNGYQLLPKFVININKVSEQSFEAQLQIIYQNLQIPLKRRHSSSLIYRQIDRKLNIQNVIKIKKKVNEMSKEVNQGNGANKNLISLVNQRSTKDKILNVEIKQNVQINKRRDHPETEMCVQEPLQLWYNKQIEKGISQEFDLEEEDICLLQSRILGNCYMIVCFNLLESLCPGFLRQMGIIKFYLDYITVCLNINGKKEYINVDYKLPCSQFQKKGKENEQNLLYAQPNYSPGIFKQRQLVEKYLRLKQILQKGESKQIKKIVDKYLNIFSYLYVQKAMADYYGGYQNLRSGNPTEIFMKLAFATTQIFNVAQLERCKTYFVEQKKKYAIALCTPSVQSIKQTNQEVQQYFQEFFGQYKRGFFFKHCYAFVDFYHIGKEQNDANFIIRVRDFRKGIQSVVKRMRQHWLNHPRNGQIYDQLKEIIDSLKSNQFLINFQDMKELDIHTYVAEILKGYYYNSIQYVLKKGKIYHFKLIIEEQTDCQIIIQQLHKRQLKNVAGKNGEKEKDKCQRQEQNESQRQQNCKYSKMAMELTLNSQIKLNNYQRHDSKNHTTWLKTGILKKGEYDLKIALIQSYELDVSSQCCTIGLKSKSKLNQICVATPYQSSIENQNIYRKWVKDYNEGQVGTKQKCIQIPMQDRNNNYVIESGLQFKAMEIGVQEWKHDQFILSNLKIKMHRLDVKDEHGAIQIHRVNYYHKQEKPSNVELDEHEHEYNTANEYSLLIHNKQKFKPGVYKIVVDYKGDEGKQNTPLGQLKLTFSIHTADIHKGYLATSNVERCRHIKYRVKTSTL